jgi:hypothetical protein
MSSPKRSCEQNIRRDGAPSTSRSSTRVMDPGRGGRHGQGQLDSVKELHGEILNRGWRLLLGPKIFEFFSRPLFYSLRIGNNNFTTNKISVHFLTSCSLKWHIHDILGQVSAPLASILHIFSSQARKYGYLLCRYLSRHRSTSSIVPTLVLDHPVVLDHSGPSGPILEKVISKGLEAYI